MNYYHLADKKQEQKTTAWSKLWSSRNPEILSMQLAKQHQPGKTVSAYRVRYYEGPDFIVRFAALGRAILRREKVEVATMRYLRKNTSIPVPEVFGHGICWAGPYIVMSFLGGVPLSMLLKDPSSKGRSVLNPQTGDRSLTRAYREMAVIIVELSGHEFDSIGALEGNEKGFFITSLPEEDCRKKFTARCLFLDITRILCAEHLQEPFQLYCDDFRPSNVLLNLDPFRISGVINWEFTYAAPAEFTWVAPWWLLLQSPKDWEGDLDLFLSRYVPRLRLFLEVLSDHESKLIERQLLSESQRLSPPMEDSIGSGLLWVCLAARYSSMFDEIYWTFIDRRYYGPFNSLDDNIQLLNPEQKQ
ncbi:phosphotransferase family protein [Aspergillus candidus]|uniref:Aminoglycoside phosphotransferase domain-containing protein n=1 Tax=Aspergillus candidus TaxID=41067 RepID=A0A2I2FL61_ASPCN|nr:hypothetical protein BDW47DRAFT_115520 [Aspergillus candidus]PLB41377.1 hypothetical protein BDW47DRAFT_115520 [Aspergillus candidus]